ncbi:hypothetical protein BJ875DRAFT_485278 [Amylocarpus encephaloides]|uniref:Uncharacterized protein n=1 Tax=Amylocarpus encephaloides TaxID=45428 RepID=A0A9P8C499_9HELO|nr:hypothetical protein BJ875DRAFT_485278 [Amylocarpus encephaloides]
MRTQHIRLACATSALAARPYLNEPDTGIEEALGFYASNRTLPPLDKIFGLPDFEWAAINYMNTTAYT